MNDYENESGIETVSKDETKVQKPRKYKVFLLNDDYTTMDFVVAVLESVFKKTPAEAVKVMLEVHNKGQGVCGIYSRQIAEAKIQLVHDMAKRESLPLKCAMEPE